MNFSTVLDDSVAKIQATANQLETANHYPRNISQGKKNWNTVAVRDWTSGFWPGVLWYAYEHSHDEGIRQQAERFTQPIECIASPPALDHDIGFMVFCSFGHGFRLTGNESYRAVCLQAANTLATLYNPSVGTILSWPHEKALQHNTIIDNMMNLELLFWAAKNGGSKLLYDIAVKHAETCMSTVVRPDFSTYHVGIFDPDNGAFIKGVTHQGYADDSQWARGQGWAIYGYAICYRETGNPTFLEVSQKAAEVFLNRLPEDGIPYWDFDDPSIPKAPKDASAAAIAACGMLELATLVEDHDSVAQYTGVARSIIRSLSLEPYLSGDTNQALLLHSTGHHPKGTEIDVPIIYADYYYMEALLRLRRLSD
ncbi:MAG: glycoside hydrolase family 88 protein [Saprospiraceae bacterium]|nr:glycoside hydrolase family 88 protein [Saprospiraceae bacterium]